MNVHSVDLDSCPWVWDVSMSPSWDRPQRQLQLGTQRCSQRSTSSKLAATTSTFASHIPSNIRALGPTKGLCRLQEYHMYNCTYAFFISQKASTNGFQLTRIFDHNPAINNSIGCRRIWATMTSSRAPR